MTTRLEHIADETINILTMKKVACLNAIWNVGTTKKDQNDQDCTQWLLVFYGDEYNESSESFNANGDDVASLFNFKNMCWKKASPIWHSSWHKKDYDLQNPKGVFSRERSHDGIWLEGSNFGQHSLRRSCQLDHFLLSWRHLSDNDYLEMAISSDNYGGILVEGVIVVIWWKLRTWNWCRRND